MSLIDYDPEYEGLNELTKIIAKGHACLHHPYKMNSVDIKSTIVSMNSRFNV